MQIFSIVLKSRKKTPLPFLASLRLSKTRSQTTCINTVNQHKLLFSTVNHFLQQRVFTEICSFRVSFFPHNNGSHLATSEKANVKMLTFLTEKIVVETQKGLLLLCKEMLIFLNVERLSPKTTSLVTFHIVSNYSPLKYQIPIRCLTLSKFLRETEFPHSCHPCFVCNMG